MLVTQPNTRIARIQYYGFNGMEKDDEVKGRGNSYDFGARMYDSRLGRWLTIDPLAGKYPSLSPYNFVGNSPLIFVDPDGEKIKFAKNLSKEEKRVFKSEIKCLRTGSETFKAMYNDLKKSKDVYTYAKTLNGDSYESETKTVFINLNGNAANYDITYVIAHETGHGWRELKNLDIKETESPFYEDPTGVVEHSAFKIKIHIGEEFEATHIENVIRSEMGAELREEYGLVTDNSARNRRNDTDLYGKKTGETLDIFKTRKVNVTRDKSYDYSENKNHYDSLLNRKRNVEDINVYEYENEKKYQGEASNSN